MEKITIDITDIEIDKDIVLETIKNHIKKTDFDFLQWTFAQVGWDKLDEIADFDKADLLYIEIEMSLLGNTTQRLISEYGFIENIDFKTKTAYDGVGALLIYWD
jgi:hypothetical protein